MQQGKQTSEEMHYPVIENAEERLTDACYAKLTELYGDDVSEVVQRRMEKELTAISNYQTQSVFLIEKHIVDDAKKPDSRSDSGERSGRHLWRFYLGSRI